MRNSRIRPSRKEQTLSHHSLSSNTLPSRPPIEQMRLPQVQEQSKVSSTPRARKSDLERISLLSDKGNHHHVVTKNGGSCQFQDTEVHY